MTFSQFSFTFLCWLHTRMKRSLFKCAISILLLNKKIVKYTFSIRFMYFSEMGLIYFSEIYLKWHLNIFELYLCSENPVFIVICKYTSSVQNFQKQNKWRRNQNNRFFHVLKQYQNCVMLWNKMLTTQEVIMAVKLWGVDHVLIIILNPIHSLFSAFC